VRSKNLRVISIVILTIILSITYGGTYLLDKNVEVYQGSSYLAPNKNMEVFPHFFGNHSNAQWLRENSFINDNLYLRQGYGYELKTDSLIPIELNPNPTRILIFGDSFLWGNGNTDPSSTLQSILYRELNPPNSTPQYEIKILSQPGRSTFNFYDLFKNNSIADYNPDVVIYGYHGNDYMPSFTESLICNELSVKECQFSNARTNPEYQACLHGEKNKLSSFFTKTLSRRPNLQHELILRACEPLFTKASKEGYDQDKYFNNPTASPYYQPWIKALSLLRESLAPHQVLVANLTSAASSLETNKFMEDKMGQAGYQVIPMNNTNKAVYEKTSSIPQPELLTHVNPINDHPSSYLNYAYAKDIISYLKDNNLLSLKPKANPLINTPKNLISYTMPYFDIINKTISPTSSRITFNSNLSKPYPQSIPTDDNLPFQYANCMNLGFSNFQFTLNEGYKSGKLKLENLPQKEKIEFGFYYYSKDYIRNYQPLTPNANNLYPIPKSNYPVSFVLSFPRHSKGCSLDKEISAPNFEIAITYQP